MARISKYATDSTVAANDRVIGTDGVTGFTKNYTISDLGIFLDATYDTDTWRTVTAGGNTLSTSETLAFTAGTGITIAESAGAVTITNSAVGANAFGNVAVAGQSTVAADGTNDTLTLVGGGGMTITTAAGTDTITLTASVVDSTADTSFPVVFNDESDALLDDTGYLTYNPSTGFIQVGVDITSGDSSTSSGGIKITGYGGLHAGDKLGIPLALSTTDTVQNFTKGGSTGPSGKAHIQYRNFRDYPSSDGNAKVLDIAATSGRWGSTTHAASYIRFSTAAADTDTTEVLVLKPTNEAAFTGEVSAASLDISGDTDITGSALVTQNLRRTVTTASESSGTHTITLVDNDNFNIAVTNAATTIALVVATENIGQSGMITITNPASVGSLSFVALPSYMLTPEGATINFVTTADAVSIISYYVLATDKVLVNYVGNFA